MPKITQSPVKRRSTRSSDSLLSVSAPGRPLDKLARQVTEPSCTSCPGVCEDDLRLSQKAKHSAKENFGKRARVKYLTEAMAVGLANVPGSRLTKSYWNTFYCSSILQKQGDKLTGKFCKNRWCLVCCRIRSAQLIKQYAPVLDAWPEKHLVTLTVPNCAAADLSATIDGMKSGFDAIRRRFTMQHRRKQRASPLVCLRKLECTHNPDRDDYHPHFHLVVPDLAAANELREAWLLEFPAAKCGGQDVRPANSGAAHELFKYFTKLVTTKSKERFIRLAPLNTIFEAIATRRTFQAFGITASKEVLTDDEADAVAEELGDIEALFEWSQAATDWVDKATGELLTNYVPSAQFRQFVESKIVYNSPVKACARSQIMLN
jgi:hypothetical protein